MHECDLIASKESGVESARVSATVVTFVPCSAADTGSNLREFIRFCREDLTVFGADLDFSAPEWDVSCFFELRAHTTSRTYISFTEYPMRCERGRLTRGPPLPEPMASFAKAYIRYHAGQRRRLGKPTSEIAAFRLLTHVLRGRNLAPDIGLVDAQVLAQAVQTAKNRYADCNLAGIGVAFERIVAFLCKKRLSENAPLFWKHGLQQRMESSKVGREFDERRRKLLPSQDLLEAIPQAFHLACEAGDVIATCVLAILCAAPSRINEVLVLPAECEINAEAWEHPGYGLRWAGSKRHPDHVKWIPSSMADVVRTALRRLQAITDDARRVAAWYETNPQSLYLPADCEHLRCRDLIQAAELQDLTGFASIGSMTRWAKHAGLQPARTYPAVNGSTCSYHFREVQRVILELLPRSFPIFDQRNGMTYSQALMVVPRSLFDSSRKQWRCMIAPVHYLNVRRRITATDGYSSVFERLGIADADRPLRVATHQFRHWLNTLGQKGGLSELDLAAWSGRRDVRQNAAYDHESSGEILERKRQAQRLALHTIQAAVGKLAMARGPLAELPPNLPVDREKFARLSIPNAHATELGFCTHDFASAPCPFFMECIQCVEHVCIKGFDPDQAQRIASALQIAQQSLVHAGLAQSDRQEGAEEWISAHRETIHRLEQLNAFLNDPDIPDGTVIQLARPGRDTLLGQAMRDHSERDSEAPLAPVDVRLPFGNVGNHGV